MKHVRHPFHYAAAAVLALVGCMSTYAQSNTVQVAAELGITPESITVAGLHESAATVLQRIDSNSTARQALATQEAAVGTLIEELNLIKRLRWDEPFDDELLADEAQVKQALDAARQQLAHSKQAFFDIVVDGLDQDAIDKLVVWRNGAEYGVPAEFCIAERTHREWKDIIRALRAVKRDATRDPEEVELLGDWYEEAMEAHETLLSGLRADFDIIEATLNLQNNLASVETVFAQFEA